MVPLHELLARIRWDPVFGRGEWVLAYEDHASSELVRVALRDVIVDPGDHFSFAVWSVEEGSVNIPFHRVRELLRDGCVVWRRPLAQRRRKRSVNRPR